MVSGHPVPLSAFQEIVPLHVHSFHQDQDAHTRVNRMELLQERKDGLDIKEEMSLFEYGGIIHMLEATNIHVKEEDVHTLGEKGTMHMLLFKLDNNKNTSKIRTKLHFLAGHVEYHMDSSSISIASDSAVVFGDCCSSALLVSCVDCEGLTIVSVGVDSAGATSTPNCTGIFSSDDMIFLFDRKLGYG